MIFSSREHLKWSQHKVCLTLERIRKLTKDRARHLGQITIMLSIWHTFQMLYFIHKATCKDLKKALRLSPTLKKRLSTQAVFRLTEVTQEQKREGSSGRTRWPWQWAAYKHSPIGTMWKHFSLFFSHFSTWAWRSHGGEMGILVGLGTALCCVTNRRGNIWWGWWSGSTQSWWRMMACQLQQVEGRGGGRVHAKPKSMKWCGEGKARTIHLESCFSPAFCGLCYCLLCLSLKTSIQ